MSEADENRARGKRLEIARENAGFTSATDGWAAVVKRTRVKLSKDTYIQHENGTRGLSRQAQNYATAFGVTAEWLMWGGDDRKPPTGSPQMSAEPATGEVIHLADLRGFLAGKGSPWSPMLPRKISRSIPVMGEVAAGLWKEAFARDIADPEEWIALDVQGYEKATLFALRVSGPSMNLIYPPGRYVICAPPAEAGVRDGDIVVVQRSKADLVEITLKELRVDGAGRIGLYPRSSDPAYQEPIFLRDEDGDQSAPQISGVVIADYSKRTRPPAR